MTRIFWGFCLIALSPRIFATPIHLASLEYSNPHIQALRLEIKENLRVAKSSREGGAKFPLRYYKYIVSKEDSFFQIMARTGMDLDTLSSVNQLSSVYDLEEGRILLIPNMRGILDYEETEESEKAKQRLKEKYKTPTDKFLFDSQSRRWFIPGARLHKKEKSFFYGFAFSKPLLDAVLSSGFGKRIDPFTKKKTFHGGMDLASEEGTAVLASAEGRVSFVGKKGGYGNLVVIEHVLGYETLYGHLKNFSVREGMLLKRGQKIGEVGMTGRATGPHLHFEVRRNNIREKPSFRDHL